MSEENSFQFAEYAKPVAKVGKNRRARLLLILLYVTFATAYALTFISLTMPQVIAILPIFVWMLVFFTWGTVSYECCVRVSSGDVIFLKLRGKKEKKLLSFSAKEIVCALPYDEKGKREIEQHTIASVLDFRADPRCDGYALLLHKNGADLLIRFEATIAVMNAMRYYNKAVTVDKDFLKY